ncbi:MULTISPECIES: DUF3046 domain-containing protein [unclassified Ornithinimicrobium]|uniref:DUF3046 domain-containing protein n=1 Tax=unclassified Ornithinimicrobium TaxID=2615080 RepID=UPI00385190CD
MRLSEFRDLMVRHFGAGYAALVAASHTLGSLGGRTADEAIAQGEPVRRVWEAICQDLDVPPEHQYIEPPRRRR